MKIRAFRQAVETLYFHFGDRPNPSDTESGL